MPEPLLPWQQSPWQTLKRYQTLARLPQALLLTGDAYLNMLSLGQTFGQSLLCQQPSSDFFACGHCPACTLFTRGHHPDWHDITPPADKNVIAIDQIRSLLPTLNLKPQHGRFRLVVLHPADTLNLAAANAFLKYLEEPSARTVIVLISESPATLPLTIRSRCQRLNCAKPSPSQAALWLRQQGVSDALTTLLAMADGHPRQALYYAEKQQHLVYINAFKHWCDIANGQRHPVDVAASWQTQPVHECLAWLTSWCEDLLRCQLGVAPNYYRHPHWAPALQALTKSLQLTSLFQWRDHLQNARQEAKTSLNALLLLEGCLLAWQQLFTH
ncbi:MAG: DNA polymerase III subunit delta' C-terminal domain-containing protein [Methylococcales bacterium]|nr:DNA polymerase III subunit delta' C-terminal domain-containing protein [Methylococcales bacterium]